MSYMYSYMLMAALFCYCNKRKINTGSGITER